MDRSNYKYVYSVETANYLMLHNAMCKGTGVNKNTGDVFWCFDKDEVEPIYKFREDVTLRPHIIDKNNTIRINNIGQVCAYIKEGVNPISVEYDLETKKLVFIFIELETKEVWRKWKQHKIAL